MERRNERQKGFTLVECMAALVVMSVLAALLVPALTRYIDEGREKQAVSEAQICVTSATEWAAKQRAALVAKAYAANKDFKDAYADADNAALRWSAAYADLTKAAPTVTGGTVALTEGDGQYVLRPDTPAPNGTANDTMKDAVTAAAEVDGRVTAMQLNADGKVLYLLYTAKNGTTVAYTAADTAKDPATTVLVAKLPENKKPDTSGGETGGITPTPSHSGDLVFRVLDEYTKQPVQGITFSMDAQNGHSFSDQTTDADGKVYYPIDISKLNWNSPLWTLKPTDWPAGCQKVYPVSFRINPNNSRTDFVFSCDTNSNLAKGQYMDGFTGKMEGSAEYHIYTFYVRSVPTLELCVLDENNNPVEGVEFTISKDTQSIPIISGSSPTLVDVKIHDDDKPRSGSTAIDLSQSMYYGRWNVKFTNVPDGYLYFDNCILELGEEPKGTNRKQLFAKFPTGQYVDNRTPRTYIECKDFPDENKSVVTIHVVSAATVTIQKTNDLGQPVSGAELKLETLDASNNRIVKEQWTTDESGTKSFPLTAGTYYLKEENAPDGYTKAKEQTFTVKDNTPFTVELVNHKTETEKDDVTIQDSVTVTFKNAENWAHKLTSDGKIKFKHEILFWKGKYYYAIPETDECYNPYKEQWDNNKLDLNADSTPNPQQWFKDNVDDKLSPYVITLTGKIWTQEDLKTKVSAENPLQRGDLLYRKEKDGKDKLYLYYGEKVPNESDKVIIGATGNNPPDNTIGTATEITGKVWAAIYSGKYTITTTLAP